MHQHHRGARRTGVVADDVEARRVHDAATYPCATGNLTGVTSSRQECTVARDERLARWAAECLGVESVELRAVLAGAGNLGFAVHTPADDDGDSPVAFLRTKMGSDGASGLGYSLQREGAILEVAGTLGFPVAPVLGTLADPDALLMGFVPGVGRPDPDEIERVAPKYVALVAAVHRSDATLFPVEQHDTMEAAMRADLRAWTGDAEDRGVLDVPLIALAARVLAERLPPGEGPPCLVHGDVGAGNFLALDGEVAAMLDWELAHLGDPHEDLAWLWMRGAHTSFGDPLARFAEYEAASGVAIDHARLAWQLALVMWKSVIALHGRLRAVAPGELAMIALTVARTYDALLGAQLVRVLGGSLGLLAMAPERVGVVEANLADELLHVTDLAADQRVVLEYLRDSAALGDWQRRELRRDCDEVLGIEPDGLLDHVRSCPSEGLLAVATVLGRAADRAAMASPKSVRRIERAQRIGLGIA